ncbi:hypothetical protein M3Y96_00654100 [Aphelenchoides besseyi]|nr:hypothetical protein M3Y96_00654100 [Aphelenchoides besseyi]
MSTPIEDQHSTEKQLSHVEEHNHSPVQDHEQLIKTTTETNDRQENTEQSEDASFPTIEDLKDALIEKTDLPTDEVNSAAETLEQKLNELDEETAELEAQKEDMLSEGAPPTVELILKDEEHHAVDEQDDDVQEDEFVKSLINSQQRQKTPSPPPAQQHEQSPVVTEPPEATQVHEEPKETTPVEVHEETQAEDASEEKSDHSIEPEIEEPKETTVLEIEEIPEDKVEEGVELKTEKPTESEVRTEAPAHEQKTNENTAHLVEEPRAEEHKEEQTESVVTEETKNEESTEQIEQQEETTPVDDVDNKIAEVVEEKVSYDNVVTDAQHQEPFVAEPPATLERLPAIEKEELHKESEPAKEVSPATNESTVNESPVDKSSVNDSAINDPKSAEVTETIPPPKKEKPQEAVVIKQTNEHSAPVIEEVKNVSPEEKEIEKYTENESESKSAAKEAETSSGSESRPSTKSSTVRRAENVFHRVRDRCSIL